MCIDYRPFSDINDIFFKVLLNSFAIIYVRYELLHQIQSVRNRNEANLLVECTDILQETALKNKVSRHEIKVKLI